MSASAELVLMATAYENFLGLDAKISKKALRCADEFALLMTPYGSVSCREVKDRDIGYDRKFAHQQMDWFVHKKWIKELYDVRNGIFHGQSVSAQSAWSQTEHLIVASFAFPLATKMALARRNLYELNYDDQARSFALDHLLAAKEWSISDGNRWRAKWPEIIRESGYRELERRAFTKIIEREISKHRS